VNGGHDKGFVQGASIGKHKSSTLRIRNG